MRSIETHFLSYKPMLRIVSYELLSYGETDTPFTLCVFFLARALLSFRYY